METETVEVEKERRTTLAYLRNAKTAESSDQWPPIQQYGQAVRMICHLARINHCSESIHAFGYWNHQRCQVHDQKGMF